MDLETFRELAADRRVIPVSRRLLADGDTPVGLYRKLAAERPGTFLLESAENGRSWSRYSFVGVRSAATLTERDGRAHWQGTPPVGVPTEGDPLAALRATVETLHTPRDLGPVPPVPAGPGTPGTAPRGVAGMPPGNHPGGTPAPGDAPHQPPRADPAGPPGQDLGPVPPVPAGPGTPGTAPRGVAGMPPGNHPGGTPAPGDAPHQPPRADPAEPPGQDLGPVPPVSAGPGTAGPPGQGLTSGMPPFTGGMVGYLGYDIVRRLEKVGDHARDDLRIPELTMLLTSDLAVLDHRDGSVLLIANAINHNDLATGVDEAYADAVARLDAMAADLARPVPTAPTALPASALPEYTALWGGAAYQEAVEDIKERIRAGEAFQVVPSQRFETPVTASALDVYRVLRATNPSPYMYLFRFDGFDVVGSSPEALVKVEGGRAMVHPIAGTRHRGATPQEDQALADELLADPKERAEHLMLVDLGRNDLGRVCEPGSVEVVDFMSVERYSHVMHIVSTVTGEVAEGRSAFDVLTACFPAGTLSGAPKPRALQIIDELEPTRRGLYGGCVGYLDFAGDSDTAIAIRTALLRDGTAYVQAGAGVVADSDPVSEDTECRNKAAAVLRAVHTANRLTDG
ncbi:chorismate-binding protein [Streptomyces corynorhini]|uniref:chorismate-binding protein n=1 Tax=Streptomyces corynorhini TaxID=2282652 RepID=UPI001F163BDF|nr:chorismate-binding protein [Streptomyces corynorhini]